MSGVRFLSEERCLCDSIFNHFVAVTRIALIGRRAEIRLDCEVVGEAHHEGDKFGSRFVAISSGVVKGL